MTFLRSLHYDPGSAPQNGFPFNIPVVSNGCQLRFDKPVTIIVGDNGAGKSTLLEALAIAIRLPTIGAADVSDDSTLVEQRKLANALKLVWNKKTRRGFFLRAEDFFNFCKGLKSLREEFQERLRDIDEEYADRSEFAKAQARMAFTRSLSEMKGLYSDDLDAMSHGESFMRLFSSRLQTSGLFILDEPEAPLSPLRQMTLIHMLRESEDSGSQFIISTHSPILMAYPGAAIYVLNGNTLAPTEWNDLEHVNLMRDFLNHPDAFIRRL